MGWCCCNPPQKTDTYPKTEQKTEELIINTLILAKTEGMAEKTRKNISDDLKRLAKEVNLLDPEEVKKHISNTKNKKTKKDLTNGYKNRLLFSYGILCKAYQIEWKRPKYRRPEQTPIIPTTENVNKIINTCTRKYATIFTIMTETGAECEELHKTPRTKIDLEQRIISITGTKGHGSANYKLKQQTTEMLREYLTNNTQENPFPEQKYQSAAWQYARNKVATIFKQPELKTIPLKNLRNYAGSQFYKTTGNHDPIATMRFMRHKKLETTLHYIRGINLNEPEEYKTIAIKLGEPDTQKQIIEYSNAGYQKLTEADGYQYFRIHKT